MSHQNLPQELSKAWMERAQRLADDSLARASHAALFPAGSADEVWAEALAASAWARRWAAEVSA